MFIFSTVYFFRIEFADFFIGRNYCIIVPTVVINPLSFINKVDTALLSVTTFV